MFKRRLTNLNKLEKTNNRIDNFLDIVAKGLANNGY